MFPLFSIFLAHFSKLANYSQRKENIWECFFTFPIKINRNFKVQAIKLLHWEHHSTQASTKPFHFLFTILLFTFCLLQVFSFLSSR